MEATRSLLSDGRWHFQHGPIDLVIGADGEPAAVGRALERLWQRFRQVLPELVGELSDLRQPVVDEIVFNGPVAQRMFDACWPHRRAFITPMAAVAGSVADELMQYFRQEASIARAYINNGGDIALHLQPGQRYRVGLFADLARFTGDTPVLDGNFEIANDLPVRGIATSGWRGRSFSLGIADSVTVLAATAAGADAAATMIANQVNVERARSGQRFEGRHRSGRLGGNRRCRHTAAGSGTTGIVAGRTACDIIGATKPDFRRGVGVAGTGPCGRVESIGAGAVAGSLIAAPIHAMVTRHLRE
jgi:ApbE superfamily uncharacterized protein (UPF0280 family)